MAASYEKESAAIKLIPARIYQCGFFYSLLIIGIPCVVLICIEAIYNWPPVCYNANITEKGGVMFLALTVFLVLLSMLCHEIGHARAMRRAGIKIQEMGMGIPIPRVPHLRFKLKKWNIDFCLHPLTLILGAYVKNVPGEERKLSLLPYKEYSLILGAGIRANLIFGGTMILCAHLMNGMFFLAIFHNPVAIGSIGLLALAASKRFFCNYIVPFFGLAMVGLLVWSFCCDPMNSVAGPIGIVKMMKMFSVSAVMSIHFAAIFSVLIGLFNALPLVPLDGGLICHHLCGRIKHRPELWQKWYANISFVIFIALIAAAIAFDFINLAKRF